MNDPLTAAWVHRFDQATGAFHQIAETVAAFRNALIEVDFTVEGAEHMSETLLLWVLTQENHDLA